MDYGGHGSRFFNNLVVTKPYAGSCIGLGGFESGKGDAFFNNTCALMGASAGSNGAVGGISQCDPKYNDMHDNHYYTPNGTAVLRCGSGTVPVEQLFSKHGSVYVPPAHPDTGTLRRYRPCEACTLAVRG